VGYNGKHPSVRTIYSRLRWIEASCQGYVDHQEWDYLFLQFAHDDQNPGSGFVSIPDYKDHLQSFQIGTGSRGDGNSGTSMNRRKFNNADQIVATLGEYPEATRQVAVEQKVALLDPSTLTKSLFQAMGEQGTLKAFVHYLAETHPPQDEDLRSDTHFKSYGAYELA
jgi:hypothetical protein